MNVSPGRQKQASRPSATLVDLVTTLLSGSPARRSALARRILERHPHPGLLVCMRPGDLRSLGLGPREAERLVAAIALGRILKEPAPPPPTIRSPTDALALVAPLLDEEPEREQLVTLLLDVRQRPRGTFRVAMGSVDGCVVDPREVFAPALRMRASGLLIAHNHPSGDPTPSVDDLALTERLVQIGELVGMPLVDHLVVGTGPYASATKPRHVSLAERRLMRRPVRARQRGDAVRVRSG